MDKYKYVDGVKYKVVPNSALGYNLVPVEEGGGSDVYYADFAVMSGNITKSPDMDELKNAYAEGKHIIGRVTIFNAAFNRINYVPLTMVSISKATGVWDSAEFALTWITGSSSSNAYLNGMFFDYNGSWNYSRIVKTLS